MSSAGITTRDLVGHLSGINDVVICPYNTSHLIGVSRIQQHLIKCRKQYPKKAELISVCLYNQSHHFLSKDLELHLMVCRDYLSHKLNTLEREKPPVVDLPPAIYENDKMLPGCNEWAHGKLPTSTPYVPFNDLASNFSNVSIHDDKRKEGDYGEDLTEGDYDDADDEFEEEERTVAKYAVMSPFQKPQLLPFTQEEINNWI